MEIEIITTKKKLTQALLAQIEEAKITEMKAALAASEGILGYINPSTKKKHRVFLINPAPNVYKVVTNLDWSKGSIDETVAYGKTYSGSVSASCKKQFKDRESRDEFIQLFKEVKLIALQKHIYV